MTFRATVARNESRPETRNPPRGRVTCRPEAGVDLDWRPDPPRKSADPQGGKRCFSSVAELCRRASAPPRGVSPTLGTPMPVHEMAAAIARAHGSHLNELSRLIWAGHAAGDFTDQDATALSEAIEARRNASRRSETRPTVMPRPKAQRAPERSVAIERRRRLASSGPLPPALASRFTTGELAVLRIVGDENTARGACRACIDAIAARAGVSRTTVKNAIRQARALGMVEVRERPQDGAKNLPNVVTVVDREWLAWMRRRQGVGVKKSTTTDTQAFRGGEGRAVAPHAREAEIRVMAFMEPDSKCSLSRTRAPEDVRRAHGRRC